MSPAGRDLPPRPGLLCLQGGRELTPPCREMDQEVVERTGPSVAVLAGAARVGSDYAGASERTRAHYAGLGADVRVVPDPREEMTSALDALDSIDLLVLPGGSPGALLGVLSGPIGARVIELHHRGMAMSGASAGAMVLCTQTVVPGSGARAPGLGLAPGLAVPHWSPGSERRWSLDGVDGLVLWGLPECGGVLLEDAGVRAVGHGTPGVRSGGEWRSVSRDAPEPVPVEGDPG